MTDCQLLELAAKAAGFEFKPSLLKPDTFVIKTHEHEFTRWNPLTDDGDALRLAVKLGLASSPGNRLYADDEDSMLAWASSDVLLGEQAIYQEVYWSKSKDDPYAATRRAIVRAAAEIGKAAP